MTYPRRTWPAALLGVAALTLSTSCGLPTTATPGATPSGAPTADTAAVVYEILGSGAASNISYNTDGAGSIAQESDVTLPWRKEITIKRGFAITTLTAQNKGSGQLTCRISVDGAVSKENTSTGKYAVVTCAGEPIT